jgi:hypothetical protein
MTTIDGLTDQVRALQTREQASQEAAAKQAGGNLNLLRRIDAGTVLVLNYPRQLPHPAWPGPRVAAPEPRPRRVRSAATPRDAKAKPKGAK